MTFRDPEAAQQAEQTGQPVELPLPDLVPGPEGERAPTVEITLPDDVQSVTVKIPVEDAVPGVVAVVVNEDGSETVVRGSVATGGGVVLTLEGSATIRLVDNTRTFTDVAETAWYHDAVIFVAARGIFDGVGGGRFDPNGVMTRGMQAKALHNVENNPESGLENAFLDVPPESWYADAVNWAAELGYVLGYGNGLYGPHDSITREQCVTLLWRYLGEPDSTHGLDDFIDADQISAYARTAMAWANEHGLVNGMGGGRLAPKDTIRRSQVAQLMMNFCLYMASK